MWRIFVKDFQELRFSRYPLLLIFLLPVILIALTGRLSVQERSLRLYLERSEEADPPYSSVLGMLGDFQNVEVVQAARHQRPVWEFMDKHGLDAALVWHATKLESRSPWHGAWYVYSQPSNAEGAKILKNLVLLLQAGIGEDSVRPWWLAAFVEGRIGREDVNEDGALGLVKFLLVQRGGEPPRDSRWLVPLVISLTVVFVPFLLAAGTLVREREIGTLFVIASAPRVSWYHVFLGKSILPVFCGFVTLLLLAIAARTLYGFGMKPGFGGAFGIQAAAIVAATFQGMAVSTFVRSQLHAHLVSAAYLVALIMLTGFSLALDEAAPIVQWISRVFPLTFSMESFAAWMTFGSDANAFLDDLWRLLGLSAVSVCVAAAGFYRDIARC